MNDISVVGMEQLVGNKFRTGWWIIVSNQPVFSSYVEFNVAIKYVILLMYFLLL